MSKKKLKKEKLINDPVIIFYKDNFPEKLFNKLVIVPESDRFKNNFKDPTGYYFVDGFNYGIYIKTIKRAIAIDIEKKLYGGKFTVRKVIKAEVR